MENLLVKELPGLSSEVAKEIQDIYTISFPAEERVNFQKIVNAVKKKRTRIFISILDNKLAGFASVTPLPDTDALYLEYMAVEPELRNQGIGAMTLKNLKEKFLSEATASGLIFEVEPEIDKASMESTVRKRRIEFYKRNGASIITCAPSYKMPNLKTKGAVDMILMWLPFNNDSNVPGGRKLKEYIQGIYTQAYDKTLKDPLLIEVLDKLVC